MTAYPKTIIVLLHSSYPFTREAGYLTSVYSNVFLDFGEVKQLITDHMSPFPLKLYPISGFPVRLRPRPTIDYSTGLGTLPHQQDFMVQSVTTSLSHQETSLTGIGFCKLMVIGGPKRITSELFKLDRRYTTYISFIFLLVAILTNLWLGSF